MRPLVQLGRRRVRRLVQAALLVAARHLRDQPVVQVVLLERVLRRRARQQRRRRVERRRCTSSGFSRESTSEWRGCDAGARGGEASARAERASCAQAAAVPRVACRRARVGLARGPRVQRASATPACTMVSRGRPPNMRNRNSSLTSPHSPVPTRVVVSRNGSRPPIKSSKSFLPGTKITLYGVRIRRAHDVRHPVERRHSPFGPKAAATATPTKRSMPAKSLRISTLLLDDPAAPREDRRPHEHCAPPARGPRAALSAADVKPPSAETEHEADEEAPPPQPRVGGEGDRQRIADQRIADVNCAHLMISSESVEKKEPVIEADAEDAHPQRLGLGDVGGVGGVKRNCGTASERRPSAQSKVSAVNAFAVQEEGSPQTESCE